MGSGVAILVPRTASSEITRLATYEARKCKGVKNTITRTTCAKGGGGRETGGGVKGKRRTGGTYARASRISAFLLGGGSGK